MSLYLGSNKFKELYFGSNKIKEVYLGSTKVYEVAPAFKTLTLYHSEGGSLTASTLTGAPGDTITLEPTYDTYWRLSGYQLTGDGSLVGNDYTFGSEDATICACFKPNAFTASGSFEKGSNVNCTVVGGGKTNSVNVQKYAITGYKTLNVPEGWYSASNRWHPYEASAYEITLNPKMTCTVKSPGNCGNTATIKFSTVINNTHYETQSNTWKGAPNVTSTYNKSLTSNVQSDYSISANLYKKNGGYARDGYAEYVCTATYIATATTGTWVATGYAP